MEGQLGEFQKDTGTVTLRKTGTSVGQLGRPTSNVRDKLTESTTIKA